jgi:hypothetical protein
VNGVAPVENNLTKNCAGKRAEARRKLKLAPRKAKSFQIGTIAGISHNLIHKKR